jgi:hypothetical protein
MKRRSIYKDGSFITVAQRKKKSDSVGLQEVMWDRRGIEPARYYIFSYGKVNDNHDVGTGSLYIKEERQKLKGQSQLVTGCCIKGSKQNCSGYRKQEK